MYLKVKSLSQLMSAGAGGLPYVNEKTPYQDKEESQVYQDDETRERLQTEELGNLARQASHHSSYSKVDNSMNPFEPTQDSALDPVSFFLFLAGIR